MKRSTVWALAAWVAVVAACGSEPAKSGNPADASAGDGGTGADGSSDDAQPALDADTSGEGGGFGPDGAVSVNCTAYGGTCTSGSSCCSGICDATAGTCASSIATCAPATAACMGNTDCCSGACINGHCGGQQCLTIGATCPVAGNACCSGNCTGGTCQPISTGSACTTANNTCTSNTQCCSGLCGSNGRCALASSYCIQTGDICYHADDCCGGICTAPNGQVGPTNPGVCSQPSSGAVNCTGVDGSICAGGSCGSCCSRLCAPYGPTGVNICQPARGCRVEGDLCRSSTDCCGGPGSGVLGDGEVICSNTVNGGDVGVCMTPGPDGGGTCDPEGDVCHYNGSDYTCSISSARADCCGPQNPKFTACVLDPFGVPRCNAYTGPSGDAGVGCVNANGACATATDCCNGNPCVAGPSGALTCSSNSCQAAGQTCTTNADCCPGLPCIAKPGSIQGTCMPVVPPPGPPPVSDDGGTPSSDGGTTDDGSTGVPDSGYAPDGGYSCALFGQSCATLSCCAGTMCSSGTCITIPR
jgi:hypothetical protein